MTIMSIKEVNCVGGNFLTQEPHDVINLFCFQVNDSLSLRPAFTQHEGMDYFL